MTKRNVIVNIFQEYGSGRIKCQKMKKCSTLAVYNDTHHHIPSVVMFQNERINKPRRSMHRKMQISEKGYIIKERRNILDSLAVYLIFIM